MATQQVETTVFETPAVEYILFLYIFFMIVEDHVNNSCFVLLIRGTGMTSEKQYSQKLNCKPWRMLYSRPYTVSIFIFEFLEYCELFSIFRVTFVCV